MRIASIFLAVLLFANTEWAAASPSDWLPTTGKSIAWAEATADARQALAKLDSKDSLTKKYSPWLKQRAKVLLRVDGFDWKSQTAVGLVEAAATDLAVGKAPLKRYAGKGVGIGYWSEAMQRIEAVWVQVPPNYDSSRDYQVFMYYKCGGGIHNKDGVAQGGYRPTTEMCRKFDDTFHVWSSLSTQLKGRSGAVVELKEVMAVLQQDFSINPDRVFVTGYSDGGFTSIWLAAHHPHLLAGAVPYCANWQYGNVAETGLFKVPVLIADGWNDGGYNAANFTRFHALRNMGYDISALFGHHGHTYQGYEDEVEMTQIMKWARKQRRQKHPRRVRYATWNLAWHQAYWFSIERMIQPALAAQIDAEVKENNRVEVLSRNVAAFRLTLDAKLVDVTQQITVVNNGRVVYDGDYQANLLIDLQRANENRLTKTPQTHGGLLAKLRSSSYDLGAMRNMPSRPWLEVRPTNVSAAQKQLVDKWAPRHAIDDTQITEADLKKYNLILYGGPDINRVAARFADQFPVQFGEQHFTFARRTYDKPEHAVQFVFPNPLASGRHMVVHACNDLVVAYKRNFDWDFGAGAGEFRTGDVAIFGCENETTPFGFTFHQPAPKFAVFDAAWRCNDEVLGGANERFGYPEVLRLWADAMQEAADVDAAVVLRFPTHWNRWNTKLPKGPLTVHDVTSTVMLPEYACLCDVSGELLKQMCREAAATSVFSDTRDPAFQVGKSLAVNEIKDEQTYRIALDNRGCTRYSYSIERSKMPTLFAFKTADEFLAAEGAKLPLKNLRYSDMEWTAAAIQYVRKHKSISPRAECFDLARYVLDPQLNQFGSHDWLHLQGQGATIHLALQSNSEPQHASPRANSKAFLATRLLDTPAQYDFSNLSRKLPVKVEMSARLFAVGTGKEPGAFRLLPRLEAKDSIGSVELVQLQLTNDSDTELQGMAILGAPQTDRRLAATWPEQKNEPSDARSFFGFMRTPPARSADLFVGRDETAFEKVRLPNVGVVGMKQSLLLPPRKTAPVTLVRLNLNVQSEKTFDLSEVLRGLEAELLAAVSHPIGQDGD